MDLLSDWGHDVLAASDIGMSRASDEKLLREAQQRNRILITRDKGFGSLVFLGNIDCPGVILLRISPERMDDVHTELGRLLKENTEADLQKNFTTVEPEKHRIRHIPTV